MTMYRAASGALVFAAGTIQWAWGLDANHDGIATHRRSAHAAGDDQHPGRHGRAGHATLSCSGLVAADEVHRRHRADRDDRHPGRRRDRRQRSAGHRQGTASRHRRGRVAGVEVSDGRRRDLAPGRPARTSWTYTGILTGSGATAIQARAIDDSGNIQALAHRPRHRPRRARAASSVRWCPPLRPPDDSGALTLGMRFTTSANGFITGIRFYKGTGNTGTHTGTCTPTAARCWPPARSPTKPRPAGRP